MVSKIKSFALQEVSNNRDMSWEESIRIILGLAGKHSSHRFINVSFDTLKIKKNICKYSN